MYYCYLLVSPFQISLILDSPFCNIFKVTGGEECLSRSIIKWFFRHFPSNFAVFTKSTCIWPNDILLSQKFPKQSSTQCWSTRTFLYYKGILGQDCTVWTRAVQYRTRGQFEWFDWSKSSVGSSITEDLVFRIISVARQLQNLRSYILFLSQGSSRIIIHSVIPFVPKITRKYTFPHFRTVLHVFWRSLFKYQCMSGPWKIILYIWQGNLTIAYSRPTDAIFFSYLGNPLRKSMGMEGSSMRTPHI